jgi:hypothetical protein
VPPGSPTLWCLGDRQHQQLRDRLDDAGVPLDAVHLAAPPDAPLGFWRLDEEDAFAAFVRLTAALADRLAFVVVDTAWSAAPSYKLHDTGDMACHFGRLADLSARTRLPLFVSNHLNREDGVLGIRSSGIARTILKLTRVDPSDRTRLRLDVDGNYKPVPPLGLTITDIGIDYATDAPDVVAGAGLRKSGPKQAARIKATAYLVAELTHSNDQPATDLIRRWLESGESRSTLFRAKDGLVSEGRLVVDDSGRLQIWHLAAAAKPASNGNGAANPSLF